MTCCSRRFEFPLELCHCLSNSHCSVISVSSVWLWWWWSSLSWLWCWLSSWWCWLSSWLWLWLWQWSSTSPIKHFKRATLMEMMEMAWLVSISQERASLFLVWNFFQRFQIGKFLIHIFISIVQFHPQPQCHHHDEEVCNKKKGLPEPPHSSSSSSSTLSSSSWPEWCLRWNGRPPQSCFPAQLSLLLPAEVCNTCEIGGERVMYSHHKKPNC